ncbi:MAG: hypothetical protein WBF90_27865 [Rivularia sp. (in: cyanobacteria)]|jgi:hypothetical protein
MSENPLYYSGNKTSKTSNLKPPISAALASLEVQLDEELARYRRTRIARRTPIQNSLGSLITAKLPTPNAITAVKSQQSLTGEEAAAYIRQQQASISENEIKTPPPPPPPPARALETFPEVTSNKEASSENHQAVGQVPFPNATTNAQNQTESVPNGFNIVKADINRNTPPENISPPPDDTKSQPDDYLESSEALLRSLQEEKQPQTKKPKNNNDSLLSPLSIGSMLLLLVSSITFGYIIFNLDNLPSLSLARFFKRNQEISSSENTQTVSDVNPDDKLAPPVSRNPNLANDQLPNINSIDDVAGATPKTKPTTVATPSPVASPAPVEQISPPVANTPAPQSSGNQTETATTPQNLDEIEPSNGGFYNVIVDNTGNTLAEVKKVIPDAYLSPEGKYVYLGAFKSKERLKNHLELLKEKGINARVEEPDS